MRRAWITCMGWMCAAFLATDAAAQTPLTWADVRARFEANNPTLRAGQVSSTLSISFLNTGSQTWTKGLLGQEARLGVNRDNETWAGLGVGWPSANRVAFQNEGSVPPGAVGTFYFQVRAPTAPGTYAINLRPVIDAVTWMEDEGVFLYVTVVP